MIDRAAAAQAGGSRYTRLLVPRPWLLASLLVVPVAELALARQSGGPAAPRAAVVFSGPAFGSRYAVRVVMVVGDEPANEKVRGAIANQIALADRLFSGWNPESEISRLNAHASTAPFPVSRETLEALELARRASELSQGAFRRDRASARGGVGLRAARRRAHAPGRRRAPGAPRTRRLPAARARRGPLDRGQGAARRGVRRLGDRRRLGGGPDRARDRGARPPDVLVDVGGEVAARGRRADGGRWRVAVECPTGPGGAPRCSSWPTPAVATSGDYRKVWTDAQGHRRSHILDPRTGRPVAHDLASVTVVDADGAWADALATTLMVLGPDAGRALAARERLAGTLRGAPAGRAVRRVVDAGVRVGRRRSRPVRSAPQPVVFGMLAHPGGRRAGTRTA
jgi:thiamine biosynthesis lipoprotein